MSRSLFALLVIAVVVIALLAMWLGWRARLRRDSQVRTSAVAPIGQLIAEFTRVLYVSTTPIGEPLSRVAVPGLRYRGQAELSVFTDGVTIAVVGEEPSHIALAQVQGVGSAGRRVGKAVESEGLALLQWQPVAAEAANGEATAPERAAALESSFRFESKAEQRRFAEAIEQLTHSAAEESAVSTATSQEDAK